MNEKEACRIMSHLRSIEEQVQACRNHIWDALHGHYTGNSPQDGNSDEFDRHLDDLFRSAEALDMEEIPAEVQLEFDFDEVEEEPAPSPLPCLYNPIDSATATAWGHVPPKAAE